MLDENLRVLGRRINDLELELEDKKDQNKALQNELDLQKQMLNKVSNKNDTVREEIQEEMNIKFEEKLKEIRILKQEL